MASDQNEVVRSLSEYRERAERNLKSPGGSGTSGGMDGWQTSVEKRLDEMNKDIRELRSGVGALNTQMATLTERVAHLPSKGFMVTAALAALAVVAALVAFQSQIQTFLKIPH